MQERPGFRFVPPLLQRPWASGHQGARGSAHGPRLARAVRQRGVPADVRPDGPEQNYLEPNEVAVRHGICGDPEQHKSAGSNRYRTASSEWDLVGSYQSGQVLEMDIVMNTFHRGHLEFLVCNADGDPDAIPTQECFNQYPLDRAPGDDSNSPIDPNFPGRYYCDPTCRGKTGEVDQTKPTHATGGENMRMRYMLPNIECDHLVVGCWYTGNTCKHIGYDEFSPPSWPSSCAPKKENWIDTDRERCRQGGYYPEEFWACSDFSIKHGASSPTPEPTPTEPMPTEPTAGCAEEWEQCGGTGGGAVNGVWTGPTCCPSGASCVYEDICEFHFWSECRPDDYPADGNNINDGTTTTPATTEECVSDWGQCGGEGGGAVDGEWTGPTCCVSGSSCFYEDAMWSDCRPDNYDGPA
ncbi:unnamed protein product [Pylaiella littoralis]